MAERSKKNDYPEHTWSPSKDLASGQEVSYEESSRRGMNQIAGWLYRKNEDVGRNNSKTYYLLTEDGKEYSVWGSSVMNSQMEDVQEGTWVRIVWLGRKAPKKDPNGPHYHDFEVFEDLDRPMPGHRVTQPVGNPVQSSQRASDGITKQELSGERPSDAGAKQLVDDTFGKQPEAPWES